MVYLQISVSSEPIDLNKENSTISHKLPIGYSVVMSPLKRLFLDQWSSKKFGECHKFREAFGCSVVMYLQISFSSKRTELFNEKPPSIF